MRWLLTVIAMAGVAVAHPMGNFSVSHYTRLGVDATGVRVTHVLDLAELPSFELVQKWGSSPAGALAEWKLKAIDEARGWAVDGLKFNDGSRAIQPQFVSAELTAADGAGGLPVFRIAAKYLIAGKPARLQFEDATYRDKSGWKEIVITGTGLSKASHGPEDKSKALTDYPNTAPPQDLRASFEWSGASSAKIEPIEQPTPVDPPKTMQATPGEVAKGDRVSQLVSQKNLTGSTLLLALALAFGFGALHATTPGHGKTMVAAYLIGERGTPKHAVLLGAVTTLTHTASVFALGVATYFLAGQFAPERVTKILEFVSGVSIAILGLWLLYQRTLKLSLGSAHGHSHSHAHQGDAGLGSLLALGASGGLVPCPSALVLLLTSIALGKVALGLVLLVSFSLGLASVLVSIGLLVLYAKHLLPAAAEDSAFCRFAPVASACVIVVVGLILTGVSLGFVRT